MVSEVALSLMLLVGAGLMIRTLWALRGTDPGFRPENVLTMTMSDSASLRRRATRSRFYDELLPQVAALPGVESAAAIDNLPMEGGSSSPSRSKAVPPKFSHCSAMSRCGAATPNYFRTMGIPIRAGRDFQLSDTTGPETAAVISQAMANLFWPGEDAHRQTVPDLLHAGNRPHGRRRCRRYQGARAGRAGARHDAVPADSAGSTNGCHWWCAAAAV